MTGYIQQFFWWCVGADDEVLRKCPKSERTKHAGYGNLILVPVILASISMSFAVSTLTGDRRIYLGAGIVWALMVFVFDRVIMSTFRKGNTIFNDLVSVSFLARFFLALLVGFVIAHPLVMFYFNSSVEGRLDERRRLEIKNINTAYDNEIQVQENKKAALDQNIAAIRTQKDEDVKQREGDLIRIMGARRSRRRASELRNIRKRLIEERDAAINKIATDKQPIDNRITELKKARDTDLQNYQQPRDYLAKENALSDLTAASGVVRWTERLIILLFLFVDILPITLKVTTKKGAYDYLLESSSQRAIDEDTMESNIHAEILERVEKRQKQRVEEVIEAKYSSPDFLSALDGDIEAIIRRSLVRDSRTSDLGTETPPVKSAESPPEKWADKFKKKIEEKGMDAAIGLMCVPLQALILIGVYMYYGSDIWRYVSSATILEVFSLFIVNFLLTKLVKLVT
ncbi:MAG: hypothetical protein QOG71_1863 [Pyrinomonadaceae bacterium]|nr:hypothetical protein [Pyrinomonadaceae bacterium]